MGLTGSEDHLVPPPHQWGGGGGTECRAGGRLRYLSAGEDDLSPCGSATNRSSSYETFCHANMQYSAYHPTNICFQPVLDSAILCVTFRRSKCIIMISSSGVSYNYVWAGGKGRGFPSCNINMLGSTLLGMPRHICAGRVRCSAHM